MSAWERESGDLPTPNLPPCNRKIARGLIVFWRPLQPRAVACAVIRRLNIEMHPINLEKHTNFKIPARTETAGDLTETYAVLSY
jgi:hypothetical protein